MGSDMGIVIAGVADTDAIFFEVVATGVSDTCGTIIVVEGFMTVVLPEKTATQTPRASAATMPRYGAKRDIFIGYLKNDILAMQSESGPCPP